MSAPAGPTGAAPVFMLLGRADCHLCEIMKAELGAFLGALWDLPAARALQRVVLRDVDTNDELRRRFGHKVPVLLVDGEVVCYGRFDPVEAERLMRAARS